MKKVLVAGDVNLDLILHDYEAFPEPGKEVLVRAASPVLGGASAICAAQLAKLGRPVAFVGKVGTDLWGGYCLDALAAAGVDVSRVAREPALRTGITVAVSSSRDRALITFLGSISSLTEADVRDEVLRGFDHLHVSSYFLQERLRPGCHRLFERAHALRLTTSLDPGFDPSRAWGPGLPEALREVDLFFPNEVELRGVSRCEDLAQGLRRLGNGRTRTVVKRAAQGAATIEGDELMCVPAFSVTPVDTTGAGDSFDAGFLHGWLLGLPLRDSFRLGAACGALSTLGLGGTARQPSAEEVEAFLRAHP
jgi:sugar/nucleoside kinase (ribokinase family)